MPFTASAGARAWSSCGTRTTSRDDLSDHVGTQGTHHLAAPATARSAERHFHACLACPPRETAGQSVVLGAKARSNAQRALERAVPVVRQQPSPEHRYAVETARRLVEERWIERPDGGGQAHRRCTRRT